MSPGDDRGRPGERAASKLSDDDNHKIPPGAGIACRVATLRAVVLYGLPPANAGWVGAQLLDLADLLECAEREGWFG